MIRLPRLVLVSLTTVAAGEATERRHSDQTAPPPIDNAEVVPAAGVLTDFVVTRNTD